MFNLTNLSAATAVAIGAIALLLVGAPLGQVEQEGPAPAAVEAIEAPVPFSGAIVVEDATGPAEVANEPGITHERGLTAVGTSELSDARLQGDVSMALSSDEYWKPGTVAGVTTFRLRIENDEGAWEGTGMWAFLPSGTATKPSTRVDVLYGEDAYEGLVAVMQSQTDMFDWHSDVEGFIIAAELPPVPERAE